MDAADFDKQIIYEKLERMPKPLSYNNKIPWIVQEYIAGTSGLLYADLIGKLNDYPIPDLPVGNNINGLMLDIGTGWGRWLVAGARKGYVPTGVDIRLNFCQTSRTVLKNLNCHGYLVCADLKKLPFKSNIFDLVWSFSVLQHVHKQRLLNCLAHVNRILDREGFCLFQVPNKNGIRNRLKSVKQSEKNGQDYNSWCIRYYTINDYRIMWQKIFGNLEYKNHSFLGLGILPIDLKYVSNKNKFIVIASLFLSFLTQAAPFLKKYSDSIYIKAFKNSEINEGKNVSVYKFMEAHNNNPSNNLNIQHLICCPVSGGELTLNVEKNEFVSQKAGLAFPIFNEIPILIESEARRL